MKQYLKELHKMQPNAINQAAITLLDALLERCTINLVCSLSGISRVTLYRWLDETIALDDMNYRDAAWFILQCETNPKIKMLLSRAPLSNPRLAKRLTDEVGETNDD